MAIANRTQAELALFHTAAITALKAFEVHVSDSRNPATAAGVDAALALLKTQLDATITDAIISPDNPNPVTV